MWHVGSSSLTKDRTLGPAALGAQSLSCGTTMEVPILYSCTECQIKTEPYRSSSCFADGETEAKKEAVTGPK